MPLKIIILLYVIIILYVTQRNSKGTFLFSLPSRVKGKFYIGSTEFGTLKEAGVLNLMTCLWWKSHNLLAAGTSGEFWLRRILPPVSILSGFLSEIFPINHSHHLHLSKYLLLNIQFLVLEQCTCLIFMGKSSYG